MSRRLALAASAALIATLACGGGDERPASEAAADSARSAAEALAGMTVIAADSAPPADPIPAEDAGPDSWTAAPVALAATSSGVTVLSALRTGVHPDYERLVLELSGDGRGFPEVKAEYVDQPLRDCGEGREIFPVGDGWLEVRLYPTDAHTPAGQPTVPHAARGLPGLENFQQLYFTCDFEAVTTVVIAMASPNPFRVLTLASPRRIVVDVEK